jgi:hypothetical protein
MIRANLFVPALLIGVSALSIPAQAQQLSPEAEVLMRSAKAQGIPMTPEQAERLAARQKEMMSAFGRLGGQPSAPPSPSIPSPQLPAPGVPAAGEADLLKQVDALRKSGGPAEIKGGVFDLKINGKPYVDPEGALANVAIDATNGDASFLVGRSNVRQLKFLSAHTPSSALPVGSLSVSRQGVEFAGVTGARVIANRFTILPDGIALWRDEALFIYRYGRGVESFALPEGFYPAEYQRGNVGTTGIILLRKDDRGMSDNAKGMRAMGSLLGMVSGKNRSDFALYDIRTNKQIPLPLENITQEGDELTNGVGMPNTRHYLWRAHWANLGKRRFAVYFAKGLQELAVTDLDTGMTKIAMNRGLGINGFSLTPDGKGSARLSGNWMFKDHTIDDLTGWFDGNGATLR